MFPLLDLSLLGFSALSAHWYLLRILASEYYQRLNQHHHRNALASSKDTGRL